MDRFVSLSPGCAIDWLSPRFRDPSGRRRWPDTACEGQPAHGRWQVQDSGYDENAAPAMAQWQIETGGSRMARKARMNPPIANPAGFRPDLSRRGFVATASAAAVGGISLAQ